VTLTPCRIAPDPDAWFPDANPRLARGQPNPNYIRKAAPAKAACRDCPLDEYAACRRTGLELTVAGVWGGLDDLDRDIERKRLGIIPDDHRPPLIVAARTRNNEPLGGPEDPRHGRENGYSHHKCRCTPCTQAHSVAKAERRERDRERGAA
jgi:hypothetical protein